MSTVVEGRATLACLYAGAVWGLFWIPLRALEGAGLHSLWITTVYFLVPAVCILPLAVLRWPHIRRAGLAFQITVAASGAALTLYSASIVFTDVVRALMLFYLMPVWSMLLARVVLKERITPIRIVAICMAISGMLIMFGLGVRFPVPRNVGDWMGLAAGVFWAITMVRVRCHQHHASADLTVGFFFWGLIVSASAALMLAPEHMPSWDQTKPTLPLLLLFMLLLVIPGTYASLWGPKFLNPGVVGLLFMTEIVVGAISAALLAGEPFAAREAIGVLLIAGASLVEPLVSLRRRRV
ncbi:DMT family transporter [Roseovarius sp. E0-M6]|uniref:DMT family transporter n=1 Tax=Roseovarius sp. E0-M6 TaxID=3127118 RepID=UPI0030105844